MKGLVHVKISDSKNKRRAVLESARTLILAIQENKHLDKVRELKKRRLQEFKKLIQDINMRLKQVDLKEIPGFTPRESRIEHIKKKEIQKEVHREVDQLTLDLAEIERKLSSL